ncbi:MAG: RNA-dependent RNA polymerase [Hangzhou nora-like virus 1]|nr:MAG: RNA-dependent RNA polymerase [Hangzhou nora-like virus 1]
MWTHNQQVVMHTQMQFRQPVYNECDDGINRQVQYYALYGFKVDDSYKRDGECGSMIASARVGMSSKWLGFYAASAGREHFCSTIWLQQIQLAESYATPQIVTHCANVREMNCISQSDPWLDLIFPGKQVDSPTGGATDFVGKYCEVTKPISNSNLKHWRLSPFSDNFEERLQPAPLSVKDERIVEELPTNLEGKPSLLAVLNSTISQPIPDNDDNLLEFCARQIENEYFNILDIKDTPNEINDVIEQAINGREGNEYVTGIEINKAAGLPFATFGAQLKSDMIEINSLTGKRKIKSNLYGQMLKKRVAYKLKRATQSVRAISFSNAKLKDAAIKLDYVKRGRGRIFHSIALDKIICDLGLFGNFKEAYTLAKLEVESALALNPHSMAVTSLVEHLRKFNNFTDADFTNFDQRLARNLLLRVGEIQCNIIRKKNPKDIWDIARRILVLEQVDTLVVEYQDITLTHRGNKSGEVKTTIDNNMARELADYYCWCKIMLEGGELNLENMSKIKLEIFREHRSAIGFGDDEVEAISNEMVSKYNFETKKIELEKLGMVVTPGNKSGNIMKVTPFDELTFLKRKFVYQHGMWTMPLDVKSLEAPFVWTKIQDHDLDIWYELIKDRLFEAALHGEKYFENFRQKLTNCSDSRLLKKIYPLIIQTYDTVLIQYKKHYYEH